MAARWLLTSLAYVCAATVQCAYAQDLLTVDQAVTEAVAHNLALAAERDNLAIADAQIVTAGLRPNPVLTVGALRPESVLKDAGVSTQDASVHTDVVFERGDKRRLRVAQAEAGRSVIAAGVLDRVRQLRLDVEGAFADVQLAELEARLARENLDSFSRVVDVNRERVRAGDLAAVELERSRLAALQFQNDVRQQEVRLRAARTRLNLLMGRRADAPPPRLDGDLRRDATIAELDQLRRAALDVRPDLQAARQEQARSTADTRLQLANGKVDVTISGEFHQQSAAGLHGNTVGAFVSVPLPLFSRNQGEIARARATETQAAERLRALSAEIDAEVVTAYGEYIAARDVVQSYEDGTLDRARDVRATTEYSYQRGEASFVELLDAVRALNDTMHGYYEARADYARSLFTLESLAGKVTP